MQRILAITAVLTLVACSSSRAQQTDATVVGKVGDRTITMKEVEDKWAETSPAERAEALQTVYDGRRTALDAIIGDIVIGAEAKKKGMSPEAYAEAEIAKRVTPVTDADVTAFYQQNIAQMQGRTLEQIAPVINRYLTEQRESQAKAALVADLRKAGPPVFVALEAPRSTIAVAPTDPVLGAADAKVTIVEFSDFQCPFCQRAAPTLKELRAKYGDKIRIVWKDYPLTQIHPQAFKAAEAARCAQDQGKFWEFHDKLFASQQALQPEFLKQYAAEMQLDTAKFNACLDASTYAERVRNGVSQGSQLGVNSTPTIYINGRQLQGAQPYEVFAGIIDEELAR